MSQLLLDIIENLKSELKSAILISLKNDLKLDKPLPEVFIEFPAEKKNGDLSSNVALISAKNFKIKPQIFAEFIMKNLNSKINFVEKITIAGNGFINFFLNQSFYSHVLMEIYEKNDNYGKTNYGKGKRILLEFVSANPTGPMHIGNARLGILGDCLAEILKFVGFNVFKEFYINNAGNQIEKFGNSLVARYIQHFLGENAVEFPSDGYHGSDITALAKKFAEIYGKKFLNIDNETQKKALVKFSLKHNIEQMKDDLAKYKIFYDNWFYESELYSSGEVKATIKELLNKNLTYEKNGAIWYKATKFGGTKDEVLVKNNGIPTYFAADIAYHKNKFKIRNFDICIDILGADHHGHVARMKGAMEALSIDKNKLHIILVQLVKLVKNGKVFKMSKRSGKSIQLVDLLDEVTADAVRFLFNIREANSKMDFEIDLAVKQDSQNPVYYVQYAHARICSIFKLLPEEVKNNVDKNCNFSLLTKHEEVNLILFLSKFTYELIQAVKNFDPTPIVRYVIMLATLFHKFYNSHRIISANPDVMQARLLLCDCVRITIKNILTLFKVSVPNAM